MQYRKKVFLKDFILDKRGLLIAEADIDLLRNNLFERGNPNVNIDFW